MLRHRFVFIVICLFAVVPSLSGFADIVEEVREALAQDNFTVADSELQDYRAHHSITTEYLEALSWMARACASNQQTGPAETYAKQTERFARQLLTKRTLDSEPHLPIALGAAIEVQVQVLVANGHPAEAVSLLKRNLAEFGKTSIGDRLRKNLNLLALTGQPAPALQLSEYLGSKPVALTQVKGSPVLLFFWAHWCVDCKAEGPILIRLRSEFGPRGLIVMAPTQRYGYAAGGQDATPQAELAYIDQVWKHYYSGLENIPVPISKTNFNTYGASTTPTLVIVDRAGKVAMYHPGAMPYDQLRGAIKKVFAN
jgi:thiol-disulfide isomerase/thioredoxin